MRVNINLNDELVKMIDDYASEKFVNRTSAISFLLSDGIQRHRINKSVADSSKHMSMLAEISEIAKSLEGFEDKD